MKAKKSIKRLFALVLALCMCMGLCATSFAATTNSSEDESFSITISNSKSGQTYNVYKIFDVTYDVNDNYSYTITSDSGWYTLFTEETIKDEDGYELACPFEFTATTGTAEEDVTVYYVTIEEDPDSDSDPKGVYSDAYIIAYLEAAIAQVGGGTNGVWSLDEDAYGFVATGTGNGSELKISLDGPGYYFVTTTTGSVVSVTTTDPNANIIDKNGSWELDKVVVDGLDEDVNLHEDAEAMGDDVEFKVTANVPLYTNEEPDNVKETYDGEVIAASPEGYLVTDYEFSDTMSAGLEIRGLSLGIDYTIDDDENYWATSSLIDTWVKINENPISQYAYNITMQLIPDTDANGNLVKDENGQVQFCGFVLTYDTLPYGYYIYDSDSNEYVLADETTGTWGLAYDGDGDGIKESLLTEESEVTFETAADLVAAVGTNYPANAEIEIDYTAHVTDEAVYDNTNEIKMTWEGTTYRHPNPLNPEYKGDEDKEDNVYVLDIEILKVDGSSYDGENETYTSLLAGAEFKLEGKNLKDVVTSQSVSYTPLDSYSDYEQALTDGTTLYFLLKSGEHTTVSPYDLESNDPALDNYVINPYWGIDSNGNQTGEGDVYNVDGYKYVAYTKTVTDEYGLEESGDDHYVTGTTGEDGMLSFVGLTVGNWTLTEITAPDGYNLLAEPITFEISVEWDANGKPTWTIEGTGNSSNVKFVVINDEETSAFTGAWLITIENESGSILPGTGGMGTTIFYIIGIIIVAGAAILLVTRRRMNRAA